MTPRQTCAGIILGAITWESQDLGYCQCPGHALHTHATGANHCRINLDGIPTIHCFHSSCSQAVGNANHQLRSDIWKIENGDKVNSTPYVPTLEDIEKRKHKEVDEQRKQKSAVSLKWILKMFHVEPADIWEQSPTRLLDDPSGDWRLLLHLFQPEDVIWIGNKFSSCKETDPEDKKKLFRRFFRTRDEWLKLKEAPNQFTCPSTFQPGTCSRSNKNVVTRKFLVIESDCLSKIDMLSVINWCRKFMRLRAIVDTAGKSLHGWFDATTPEFEAKLRTILPNLGRTSDEDEKTLDPALFKIAQPCRLPGALRDGKHQNLYYLDLQ